MSDKNKLLVACLMVLSTGKFAADIVYFAQLYHITSNLQITQYLTTAKALLAVIMFADTILAVTLVVLLRRRKSGFNRTDSLFNRIMGYTIGTGLISGAWAFVGFLAAFLWPSLYIYVLVMEVIPKRELFPFSYGVEIRTEHQHTVYFNCMLSSYVPVLTHTYAKIELFWFCLQSQYAPVVARKGFRFRN